MPGIGTRFGTQGIRIGWHRCRSTPTTEFSAPTRVADRFELGVLGFDVPEEALDPGLVSRGAESSEALGDSERGEELTGGFRCHLGAVV